MFSLLKKELRLIKEFRISHVHRKDKIGSEKLTKNMIRDILGNNFSILLGLATIIATFGLLSNSAATIIGGMIVAPLIIPIMGFAYGLVILNLRLLSYSFVRLIYGVAVTIFLAFIFTEIIGFRIPESEILSRTEPTILDLGVAIAAGTAGAYAKIHRSVSDAIPGVAIAVALVPPLCVLGIGLSVSDFVLAKGSFLLFLTNLIGIILSALIVFVCKSYGNWKNVTLSISFLFITTFIIALPLNFSFREMIVENRVRYSLHQYDIRYSDNGFAYINYVQVNLEDDQVWVVLDIVIPPDRLKREDFRERQEKFRQFLSKVVGEPINLRVRYLPVSIVDYEVSAPNIENKSIP